jgi:hypothetical protein
MEAHAKLRLSLLFATTVPPRVQFCGTSRSAAG